MCIHGFVTRQPSLREDEFPTEGHPVLGNEILNLENRLRNSIMQLKWMIQYVSYSQSKYPYNWYIAIYDTDP